MNILRKLLLLLMLVSLTLVSCDLFVEEDEKIPDYIGTWKVKTQTRYMDDSIYEYDDYSNYFFGDKSYMYFKIKSEVFNIYCYSYATGGYIYKSDSYVLDGDTFVTDNSIITITNSNISFTAIDTDDYDEDLDFTEEIITVYNCIKDDEIDLSQSIGTDNTAPGEVTNLSLIEGDGFITITWTDPIDPDLYEINIDYGDGEYNFSIGDETYTFIGLKNGTTYEFTVTTSDLGYNESEGLTISGTPHI